MTIPSKKSPEMNAFLNALFDRERKIKDNHCTSCGARADRFRDNLSRKEYSISGLCQACQDSVFTFIYDEEE